MAKKKVTFENQMDESGVQDRRAHIEPASESEVEKAEPSVEELEAARPPVTESAVEQAHSRLDALGAWVSRLKDDDLIKDHKMSQVDINLVRDLHDRKARGKSLHLSDGNIERLGQLHGRHSKHLV